MMTMETLIPLIFAALMGLSMLMYAILDGYDLGVGMLITLADDEEKDLAIGSIGPFWDANETWLVLGVGLLLVAFPQACGIILSHLYLPTTFMLVGLILRGVAFDFRAKAHVDHKRAWNAVFSVGSTMVSFFQGYMLGNYILGFSQTLPSFIFSVLVGLCVIAGYCLIGASWLIFKTENTLQQKAVHWAKYALLGTAAGIAVVSIATPLVSSRIFHNWFSFPNIILLAPVPLMTGVLIVVLFNVLKVATQEQFCRLPLIMTMLIFIFCFNGLAYSFYPYIVPEVLTIEAAASSIDSLMVILIGVGVVFPFLIAYTFYCYHVFHGKAKHLAYR